MGDLSYVQSSLGPDGREHHPNEWYNQDFEGYRVSEHPLFTRRPLKLVCVGAGATGLQIAHKVELCLKDVELVIYEKNSDLGGSQRQRGLVL